MAHRLPSHSEDFKSELYYRDLYLMTYCEGGGSLEQDSKYASRKKYLSKKFGGVDGVSMTSFPSANCTLEMSTSVAMSHTGGDWMTPVHNHAGH